MLRIKKSQAFDKVLWRGSPLVESYDDFEVAVKARQPLIFIDTYDYETVDMMVNALLEKDGLPIAGKKVFEYAIGAGRVDFETRWCGAETDKTDIYRFILGFLGSNKPERMVVIKGLPPVFEQDEKLVSLLRMVAGNNMNMEILAEEGLTDDENKWEKSHIPFVLVSPSIQVPDALQPFSKLIRLKKPKQDDIVRIVNGFIAKLERTETFKRRFLDQKDKIASYLSGMCESEIRQVLNTIVDLGPNAAMDVVARAKRDMVLKTGFLKLCEVDGEKNDFAGLLNLKEELRKVRRVSELRRAHPLLKLDSPKGVLLVGMPGCGKSLAANVAANKDYLDRPLIQLDVGKLLGKYVGQSEHRMRRALEIAEAAAPCILWIDELEKAFSGLDSSDGTSKRLLGTFLTWLQEKKSEVYVIATANSVKDIPPELLRRGRFDEIFRLMLPSKDERKSMFKYHCERIGCRFNDSDFSALASASKWEKPNGATGDGDEGFSGADIEYVVRMAFRNAIMKASDTDTKGISLSSVLPTIADIKAEIRAMHGKTQRDRMLDYKSVKEYLDKSGFKNA